MEIILALLVNKYAFLCWRILDFGLARATDQEMTGYVATHYWCAPEIMLNWMHYGKQGAVGGVSSVGVAFVGVARLTCLWHVTMYGLCLQ